MDFSVLQSTVAAQFDAAAQTFKFNPQPFKSTGIDDLLTNVVKQKTWELTGVQKLQPDAGKKTVTLSGTCSKFFEKANATLTMVFFLDDGANAQLLVKLDLGDDWSFTGAFKQLEGTVFADASFMTGDAPLYTFASAKYQDATLENGTFVTGMNFYGKIVPGGGAFKYVKDILGAFANTTAVGPMSIDDDGPNMKLTLGFQNTLEKYFPLLKNVAGIQLVSQFSKELGNTTGLRISTTFKFGSNEQLEISTVLNPWILDNLFFVGEFENVLLPSPSEFAQEFEALIGKNDLGSALPGSYGSSSHLALKTIGLGLDTKTWKPSSVSFEIGTPEDDLGWQLGDFATVKKVSFAASVQNPFATDNTRSIDVIVSGEVDIPTAGDPIDLTATAKASIPSGAKPTYELAAGLAPGSTLTIPIGDLLEKYIPAVTDAPNIVLNQLEADFKFQEPKNHYGFRAGLDPEHPLTFKLGGAQVLKVFSGSFHLENDINQGKPGGGVEGGIEIFDVKTVFSYEMPGDFKVTASIPEFTVDVPTLVDGLVGGSWQVPDWFPTITFPQTDWFISHSGGDTSTYTFAIRAKPSFGTIVLQVVKSTNWSFAAGLQLDAPKISAFPSLNFLSGMDDLFSVDELLFVFASSDMPSGFQFPPTTAFPKAQGKNITFPSWAGTLKAGFYFYGQMTLNIAQSMNLALVQKMFGLDTNLTFNLLVFLGLNPEQNAKAQAGLSGKVNIGENTYATLEGYLGAQMEAGEPQFYVEGVISTNILDSLGTQNLTAAVSFELTENAAFLAASMTGSITFGPITLSDLVIVVGIDFEGIPSIGFAAQIDLSAYDTTYDSSIAFFFDSGDPAKSLFAGAISDINMGQVLDTIVGVITDGADKPPQWLEDMLKEINLEGTDHFNIPTSTATALDSRDYTAISKAFNTAKGGSTYQFTQATTLIVVGKDELDQPGKWFITDYPANDAIHHYQLVQNGDNIDVSLEAQLFYCMPPGGGSVTLGPPSHGIVFNDEIFVAGVLKFFMLELEVQVDVKPNKGLIADVALLKPVVIIKDFIEMTDNEHPDQGPQFNLATFTQGQVKPHLYIDGKITFLGITTATTINISTSGLMLKFMESIGNSELGADVKVDAELDSIEDFSLGFSADVHINKPDFKLFSVDLGTLDLVVDVGCDLSFGATNGNLFLKLDNAHFEFGDMNFSIPGFDLELSTDTLEDLPGIIFDAVKNLIWDFLKDAAHWLEWVGKGIIKGVSDVEKVLEDVFHAIGSVWSNEKRIVVAIHESFSASNSGTITITPNTPTDGVTQVMIDEAHTWAEQAQENLVTQAVIDKIQQTPPDGVADFKVDVVQNIDETFTLSENQTWLMVPQGSLPSLTSLGFKNPWKDRRFYTQTKTQKKFETSINVSADFSVVSRVTVTVKYNDVQVERPWTFTSEVAHKFSTAWVADVGDKYQVQYKVTYVDSSIPEVTSPWINQKGSGLTLLVPSL